MIHRMRMGQSDRTIAQSKLMGRLKCNQVRTIARQNGWLDQDTPLPDDSELARVFALEKEPNPTRESLSLPHKERIEAWLDQGVQATTIYQALVDQFGFSGSYSSVRRFVQNHQRSKPKVTCILEFAPGEAAQMDFGKGPTITVTVNLTPSSDEVELVA